MATLLSPGYSQSPLRLRLKLQRVATRVELLADRTFLRSQMRGRRVVQKTNSTEAQPISAPHKVRTAEDTESLNIGVRHDRRWNCERRIPDCSFGGTDSPLLLYATLLLLLLSTPRGDQEIVGGLSGPSMSDRNRHLFFH